MNANSLPNRLLFWFRPKPAPAARNRDMKHAGAKSVLLPRNQAMTIADVAAAGRIQVVRGAIWLTGTPAEKDVVLQAEESLHLPDHYPFVVEALTDAEISLMC